VNTSPSLAGQSAVAARPGTKESQVGDGVEVDDVREELITVAVEDSSEEVDVIISSEDVEVLISSKDVEVLVSSEDVEVLISSEDVEVVTSSEDVEVIISSEEVEVDRSLAHPLDHRRLASRSLGLRSTSIPCLLW
jgi:hypothetical protein